MFCFHSLLWIDFFLYVDYSSPAFHGYHMVQL